MNYRVFSLSAALGMCLTIPASGQIAYPGGACLNCDGQTYRIVYQTVYDERQVTAYRVEYETVYEEQKVTSYRPEW
ncbi:MAG: hypothetical protein PHO07_17665, partial [Pirellulales bacterium]|nr:hypothetical protein [Pirellulales bacterium]